MSIARRAIFPGSFDPLTLGHLDVIERASKIFDVLTVAVLANTGKSPWFSAEERVALIAAEVSRLKNVNVVAFSGLLVAAARRVRATTVIRGVRGGADLEPEIAMARTNRALDPRLDTVFLSASPHVAHVASKLVREIALLGGSVTTLVPPRIARATKFRAKEIAKR